MTFSTIILFVTALLLLTSVQAKLAIINPIASTTWVTGQLATVTWAKSGTITEQTVPLVLLNGPENKLKQIFTIASSVDVDKLNFNFTVPYTIGSGNDYTVQIGVKELNYSARFTITNNNSTATTKSTTKPTATTNTAIPATPSNTQATNTPPSQQPTRPKSAANTVVPALHSLIMVLGAIVLLLIL